MTMGWCKAARDGLLMMVMLVWSVLGAQAQQADDVVFVQIEAQPSLSLATQAAREYAGRLPDVNGFALGGGWYGVALGPYTRVDATQVLRVYRAEREIPRDSYIASPSDFRQQFWPVGANVLSQQLAPTPPATQATETAEAAPATDQTQAEVATQPAQPDETRAEAQRSEARLTRDEKKDLQIALQWAGFYRGAIDGAYGRGTRGSMSAWQEANGFEVTGVLTTLQRAALLKQYTAVLDALNPQLVQDAKAGVDVIIPAARVAFEKYDYPFAHYTGDGLEQVLLISQRGDQNTLFGLYDIMQTLDIVPLDGPRDRKERSFRLKGENGKIVSETIARLDNGMIKGFTLVWPAGDEEARTRLLAEMEKSFATTSAALEPSDSRSSDQSIDLVAGLTIRSPLRSRSGFFIDSRGTVVTAAEVIGSCSRVTIDQDAVADVVAVDSAAGVAVLKPQAALAPLEIARFSDQSPRLGSEVAVAGFSYEGALGAPSMTFGSLSDVKGLNGEDTLKRLALASLPGDVGGPVLDAGGGVLGMLLPRATTGRSLPEDVQFAINRDAIQTVLEQAGMAGASTNSATALDPVDLSAAARDMTVLVSCWE